MIEAKVHSIWHRAYFAAGDFLDVPEYASIICRHKAFSLLEALMLNLRLQAYISKEAD